MSAEFSKDPSAEQQAAHRQVALELDFDRVTTASPRLRIFRRNAATWEMLLILAQDHTTREIGLFELVEEVQSDALGVSAKLKFLRDRRKDGTLLFKPQTSKRNKWSIEPAPDILAELNQALDQRNGALMAQLGQPTEPSGASADDEHTRTDRGAFQTRP